MARDRFRCAGQGGELMTMIPSARCAASCKMRAMVSLILVEKDLHNPSDASI
jgi:hypothetical protein